MSDRSLQYWREQQVYLSSACYGSIDGAVLTWNKGVPSVVIRGWLFHESETVSSLLLTFGGSEFEALPIGLPREDVFDALRGNPRARHSGFLCVIAPIKSGDIVDGIIQPSFLVTFKGGGERRGLFDGIKVSAGLLSPEPLDCECLQYLLPKTSEAKLKALIVAPQLTSTTLRNRHQELIEFLTSHGIEWKFYETDIDRSSGLLMHEIISLQAAGRYSHIFCSHEEAFSLLIGDGSIFIQSPTDAIIENTKRI